MREAIANIRHYHEHQLTRDWEIPRENGVRLGQRVRPLEIVGLYVPGGSAAYPSTVMMNAVPAQVAGVGRIVVVTPPAQFEQNPVIAATLKELGLFEVYTVGGAQAVAALAYGTETIPRVDKIVGPGNQYVAAAKKLVYGAVDIDSIAGPSEIVVIADDTARADFVAADLLSQAEHSEDAAAILITPSEKLAEAVRDEIVKQTAKLVAPRDHRTLARRFRRADRGRIARRPRARSPTESRPNTSRSSPKTTKPRPPRSTTPARSSSARIRRSPWAIISPALTTSCRPEARRAFPRRSAYMTF